MIELPDYESYLKKWIQLIFGVQPADIFNNPYNRLVINKESYVTISSDKHSYASDAISKYLSDNLHLPEFRKACKVSNGMVYAVLESEWENIFEPFNEKLGEIRFLDNNQYISFRRVDGHPFGAMPKYWEGDYMEANLTDPHIIDLSLLIHYLILKPTSDSNALKAQRLGELVTHTSMISQQPWKAAMPMNAAYPQGFIGSYGVPMASPPPHPTVPLYGTMATGTSMGGDMTTPLTTIPQGYPYPPPYSGGGIPPTQQRTDTHIGYQNYL